MSTPKKQFVVLHIEELYLLKQFKDLDLVFFCEGTREEVEKRFTPTWYKIVELDGEMTPETLIQKLCKE